MKTEEGIIFLMLVVAMGCGLVGFFGSKDLHNKEVEKKMSCLEKKEHHIADPAFSMGEQIRLITKTSLLGFETIRKFLVWECMEEEKK